MRGWRGSGAKRHPVGQFVRGLGSVGDAQFPQQPNFGSAQPFAHSNPYPPTLHTLDGVAGRDIP